MSKRRAILSVVLLFQIAVVTIGPNKETYHGMMLSPIFEPIFNALELGPNWSFFAPDPGPPPIRLEWEVVDEHDNITRTGFFPDGGYPYFINERQTRRVALARFFVYSDERHLGVWSSWVCRSNPDANSVRLWKAEGKIPNLFKVQNGEEIIETPVYGDRKSIGNVFCHALPKKGEN